MASDERTEIRQTAQQLAAADWPSDYLQAANLVFLGLNQLSSVAREHGYLLTESDRYPYFQEQLTQLVERGEALNQQHSLVPKIAETLGNLRIAQRWLTSGRPAEFWTLQWPTEIIDQQRQQDRRIFCRRAIEQITRLYGSSGQERIEEFSGQLVGLGAMALEFLTGTPMGACMSQFTNDPEMLAAALHAMLDNLNVWGRRPAPYRTEINLETGDLDSYIAG